MKNISRRRFITKTLLALSSSIVSNPIYSNQLIKLDTLSDNSDFQRECYIVYQEWVKREPDSPIHYILNSMNNNDSTKLKISQLTKIDFQNQNFFSINGLLLGKTEAAFLALLGANFNY